MTKPSAEDNNAWLTAKLEERGLTEEVEEAGQALFQLQLDLKDL
jgi:hypothetical protein